jgi:putative heme-binding domain-containing protein
VDGQAKSTGPDLSKIGKKYPREKLLDQIIKPDESIEEAYQAIIVLTSDGSTTIGRVLKRTDEELTLQPGTGEPIKIAIDSIEMEKRSTQSLMPVELLSNLTKQQAADLLAYLEGLK